MLVIGTVSTGTWGVYIACGALWRRHIDDHFSLVFAFLLDTHTNIILWAGSDYDL